VAKAIMQQNKTIKDTWLIILAGVTPSIVWLGSWWLNLKTLSLNPPEW
jgi:hypothetical protein